jgi:GMP reductase
MVSDGGCSEIGHINKAFGGGAHFVMLGSMLAGHQETDGEIIEKNGEKFIKFFGMSSNTALTQYNGGKEKYRASEGRTTLVPYRGSVHDTISEIKGGISSCMTYINARKLKDIPKCTTFVKVQDTLNRSYEKYTIGN